MRVVGGEIRSSDRTKVARAAAYLGRFLLARLVVLSAATALGTIIGLFAVPWGGWNSVFEGALAGAVLGLFVALVFVVTKRTVGESLVALGHVLFSLFVYCVALAAAGTIIGLILLPWFGWDAVAVGAAFGACTPFLLMMVGAGDFDDEFFRETYASVRATASRVRGMLGNRPGRQPGASN